MGEEEIRLSRDGPKLNLLLVRAPNVTKLERLVSAVRKAFENPNLMPKRDLCYYVRPDGKVECCGIGACYVAAGGKERGWNPTMAWATDEFGIDGRLVEAFTAGFDNALFVSQDTTEEEREYYTAGLNLGLEYVDRVA